MDFSSYSKALVAHSILPADDSKLTFIFRLITTKHFMFLSSLIFVVFVCTYKN